MENIIIRNPYTSEEVGSTSRGTAEDIDRAVQEAKQGAVEMRALPLYRRAEILTDSNPPQASPFQWLW